MKKLTLIVTLLIATVLGAALLAPVASVGALDPLADICSDNSASTVCENQDENAESFIGTLVDVLLFVVGALAVVMIIVSGIFYVISSGDAGKVAKAKNTLMYSIVGLVVAFIAYAVVNWILVDVF